MVKLIAAAKPKLSEFSAFSAVSVFIALLITLSCLSDRAVLAQAVSPPPGTIRGVIVDARDGTPLEKVSVRVQDTKQTTMTGSDGRFEVASVPAGQHELYISSVDYILVRRSVDVASDEVVEHFRRHRHLHGDG
jgi:hypothetical protein